MSSPFTTLAGCCCRRAACGYGLVDVPSYEHQPVLLEPILELLNPQPGQVILDGTVGLGGHAVALLPKTQPGGRYVGLDLDEAMLAVARARMSSLAPAEAFELRQANYADFPEALQAVGLAAVDHILFDLGVNSAQLADPLRGFSFEREGPLDMRFDRRGETQAIDLVNALTERELADLFYFNAQEAASRKIAKRICQVRHEGRITTTQALARAVASAFSDSGGRSGKLHPATRVFQALRIAVNDELGHLERALAPVPQYLRTGGCLAVISFHSLEDGMVKRFMRQAKADNLMEEVTRRPIIADNQERSANPRSRSAKLRVARRLESQS